MALTISIREGAEFYVGDLTVKVSKVISSSDFYVEVNNKEFNVNEDGWTRITKGVELRAPFPRQGERLRVRVQINAPDHFVTRENSRRIV